MESASERLAERLAELPEDEREALAEDVLARMAYDRWHKREIQPALDSHARGESTSWEGSEAFMTGLKKRYGVA